MNSRVLWSVGGAVVLVGLFLLSTVSVAQRPGGQGPMDDRQGPGPGPVQGRGPGPNRFVVAFASAEKIVILDTVTGQLYAAKESDFKKMSELPKAGEPGPFRPPFFERDKEKDKDKDKDGRDRPPVRDRRPRDRGKDKDKDDLD